MKSLTLMLTILASCSTLLTGAIEKEVKSEIKQVTLYPDRAQINSEAAISLQSGETILTMKGLSPYIVRSTILVSGEGGFTIMGVSHNNNFLSATGDSPEVKDLKQKIDILTAKVEDEKTAIEVLKERESFLITNRQITGKDATLTVDHYKAMLELYSSNIEQIRTTILKKNRLIIDYEKQLTDLNNQLNQSVGKRRLPTGEIAVTVSSSRAVTGKLVVSYIVTNAGWTPSYDVRVDGINKPVTLAYMANIFQTTGNDWKGVKLSFTNATPSQSGIIPVLQQWYINFLQPLSIRGSTPRLRAAGTQQPQAKMEAEELAFALDEVVLAEAPEVSVTTGTTTLSFDLAIPSDVLSDGKIKTIEIGRATSEAQFAYESVPKLNTQAFLTARIEEWEKLNIIGGQANLYFENTYVGQSYLSPAQFGDTMKVSLGSDKGITIKRDRVTEYTGKRLLGNNRIDTRSFKVTVRNNKPDRIKLRITDQIPVSASSEITVEATELSGGRLNNTTGLVTWEFELESKQSRDFVLTYTVKYPKDKDIILE